MCPVVLKESRYPWAGNWRKWRVRFIVVNFHQSFFFKINNKYVESSRAISFRQSLHLFRATFKFLNIGNLAEIKRVTLHFQTSYLEEKMSVALVYPASVNRETLPVSPLS